MRPLLLLLLLAVGLAGCGSNGGGDSAKTPKAQFASSCGSCHTLADAGTSGTFGPNLDELKPDQARVLAAIASGPGGMPADILEGAEADAVAGYVAAASGG